MKRFEKDLAIVVEYCRQNIWEWETRVSLALDKIGMWRAPLEQVDGTLFDDIVDAISECEFDYGLDRDNIAVEDVIWAD